MISLGLMTSLPQIRCIHRPSNHLLHHALILVFCSTCHLRWQTLCSDYVQRLAFTMARFRQSTLHPQTAPSLGFRWGYLTLEAFALPCASLPTSLRGPFSFHTALRPYVVTRTRHAFSSPLLLWVPADSYEVLLPLSILATFASGKSCNLLFFQMPQPAFVFILQLLPLAFEAFPVLVSIWAFWIQRFSVMFCFSSQVISFTVGTFHQVWSVNYYYLEIQ